MKRKHRPMPDALLDRVAEQFRALSEPSRLKLMNLLFDGERTVGELVDASGLTQANVSKHLSVLHRAGWVTREKRGTAVVYAQSDPRTVALCETMCARVREQVNSDARRLA